LLFSVVRVLTARDTNLWDFCIMAFGGVSGRLSGRWLRKR
jgi:hypothetical protein